MTSTEMRVGRGDVVLAGTLWRPGRDVRSAVVMHPGSGPSDRHNDVYFPPIRERLLDGGHAVASFDKRGVGESTGDWTRGGIEEQASDLVACVHEVARALPGVPVGVLGHSQGGWVAFEAAGHPTVSFAVASSGPGVSPCLQERFSFAQGIGDDATRGGELAGYDRLMELIAADDRRAATALLGEHPALQAHLGPLVDEALWPMTRAILAYDPTPALRRVRCPLLAVYGAADDIVPVDASLAALATHVDRALLTTLVLPGADHRLGTAGSQRADASFLAALASFVADVVERGAAGGAAGGAPGGWR